MKSPASVRKKVAAGGGQHIREEDGWCGVVHRAEVMMCTIDQALDSNDKLRAASMNITQERIRGARRRSRRPPEPAPAEQVRPAKHFFRRSLLGRRRGADGHGEKQGNERERGVEGGVSA